MGNGFIWHGKRDDHRLEYTVADLVRHHRFAAIHVKDIVEVAKKSMIMMVDPDTGDQKAEKTYQVFEFFYFYFKSNSVTI